MDHLTSENADRLRKYLDRYAIQVVDALGAGADGSVWSTSRRTALKLHRNLRRFRQERDVYLRMKQKRLHRLAGFSIPILLYRDDHARVLELSIVSRPFVPDSADGTLDRPVSGVVDAGGIAGRPQMYGDDRPEVKRLLDALLQYGIGYVDVHPPNISLRP